jgi:ubiquinone/menaquinone biosynthesis C-methylase UbiE
LVGVPNAEEEERRMNGGAFVSPPTWSFQHGLYIQQTRKRWRNNKRLSRNKYLRCQVANIHKKSIVEKLANWLVETPLIVPLWYGARKMMTDTAENLGIKWREEVKQLAQSRTDWEEVLRSVCNQNISIPRYYSTKGDFFKGGVSFHGYPAGNLCWEAAFEQHLASQAVGARNFEEAGILGEQVFRGKYASFLLQHVSEKLLQSSHSSILDVGCGTGTSSVDLKQIFPRAKITGIDLSPYMIAVAKHRFASYDIEFLHDLAEATQMQDESFDLVSMCLLIHELPYEATKAVFREAYRVLKEDGYLAIFEMDPSWEGNRKLRQMPIVFTLMRSTEPYLEEYFYRVAPCVKELLEEAGFHFIHRQQGLSKRGHLALIAQKKKKE